MINKIILIIVSLNIFIFSEPYRLNSTIKGKINILANSDSLKVWTNVISRRPKVYFGVTFATFPYSFEFLKKRYFDYNFVSKSIGFLRRILLLQNDHSHNEESTIYIEAGSSFVQSWAILDIDSMGYDKNGMYTVIYKQNHNVKLNKYWDGKQDGFFVIKNKDFNVIWYLKKLTENSCRVGVAVWITPNVYIPKWMYNIVAKRFMPHFLNNLKKSLDAEL